MDALFKKFVNTGVGYLSQGTKLVQATIEKLVEENKLSEQEGQKIVADLLKSGETKRADLEKQFKNLTDDLKSRVGLKGEAKPDAPAGKTKAAPKPTARKAPPSPTTQAAGTTKKGAEKVSAAGKAPRPAATKAGAPKKAAAQSADDSGAAPGPGQD